MKIALIGDSGIASLHSAYKKYFENKSDINVTFFGARGELSKDSFVNNGKIFPIDAECKKSWIYTSRGKAFIDLSEYHTFILHGLGFRQSVFDISRFSQEVINQAFEESYYDTIAFQFIENLKSENCNNLYLASNPQSAGGKNPISVKNKNIFNKNTQAFTEFIYRRAGFNFLNQNESTLNDDFSTMVDFSRNSQRLAVGDEYDGMEHPENDRFHMNIEYGKIWWQTKFFKQ
ncbi:hypothetical protein N9446_00230 [bacterium]|nr:hypothetical protein [bacterium]